MPDLMSICLMADSARLPLGKGIAMILFFGPVGLFATIAAFSKRETLVRWAEIIGTKNPLVARIVCVIGAVVGWGAVAATIASLSGALD